jgi:hypothetical protein
MTGEPYVLATAIVRACDGRSILDRTAGEPERRFAADPDRMHTAVMALTEAGVTVVGTGRTALWLLATPAAFADAFDVTLVPDGGGTNWAVRDPTTTQAVTWFDVAQGRFAGPLHRVVLTAPATLTAIKRTLLSTANLPRPGDLLLGEVGSTVMPGAPPRSTTPGAVFPAGGHDLLDRTRDSIAAWLADPLRTSFEPASGAVQRGSAPVTLIITEPDGLDSIGRWFEMLLPHGRGPAVPGTWFERRGTPCRTAVTHPVDLSIAEWMRTSAGYCRTIERALKAFQEVCGQVGDELNDLATARATLLGQEPGLVGAARSLSDALADQVAFRMPLPDGWTTVDPATFTTAAVRALYDPVRDDMDDVVDARVRLAHALALRDAFPLATQGGTWATLLEDHVRWLTDEVGRDNRFHGTMTSYAAMSLAGTAIDVVLAVGDDFGADQVRAILDRQPARRHVISMSWTQDGDITDTLWASYRNPIADVLRWSDVDSTLPVAASGNSSVPRPGLSAMLFALGDASLTVGGCEPAGGVWAGSGATHGFALQDARFGPAGVTVPQVCATTSGDEGGSLIIPVPSETPEYIWEGWGFGGGSSQSTAIVAALCALVWSKFPLLTASQVRNAVVDSAETLTTGTFAQPGRLGTNVVPGSDGDANSGRRRARLDSALAAAAAMTPPGPATSLLTPRSSTGTSS